MLFSASQIRTRMSVSAVIDQAQNSTIRVVLLDALGLFRSSLSRFLESAGLAVAGECASLAEALDLLKRCPADVILFDLDLGVESGDLVSAARAAGYEGRFLAFAAAPDVRKSAAALKLGAAGIFLKSEPPDRLVEAIRSIARGDVWIDSKVLQILAGEVLDRYRHRNVKHAAALDDRERRVLDGILGGLSNRTIGDHMGLSESSVKNTVQRLFHRGGVKTRSQLVRMALEGSFGIQDSLSHHANGAARQVNRSAARQSKD